MYDVFHKNVCIKIVTIKITVTCYSMSFTFRNSLRNIVNLKNNCTFQQVICYLVSI